MADIINIIEDSIIYFEREENPDNNEKLYLFA